MVIAQASHLVPREQIRTMQREMDRYAKSVRQALVNEQAAQIKADATVRVPGGGVLLFKGGCGAVAGHELAGGRHAAGRGAP